MKKHIPNTITLGNLASGMLGLVFLSRGQFELAAYCIWFAAILDFFDGFAARLLKVSSDIGKQLDSLADMVSFGVLPSLMLFTIIYQNTQNLYLAIPTFSIGLFSALRLAKFNVDDSQSSSFKGLPTPACAFFVSSIPFIISSESQLLYPLFSLPEFLSALALILAFLLVSPLRLIAFKFKNFGWKGNKVLYLLPVFAVICIVSFGYSGLAVAILLYIAFSVIFKTYWFKG